MPDLTMVNDLLKIGKKLIIKINNLLKIINELDGFKRLKFFEQKILM